jgi:hypothetical protein
VAVDFDVQIYGLQSTKRLMRELEPELLKDMNREIRDLLKPIAARAQSLIPCVASAVRLGPFRERSGFPPFLLSVWAQVGLLEVGVELVGGEGWHRRPAGWRQAAGHRVSCGVADPFEQRCGCGVRADGPGEVERADGGQRGASSSG